MDHRVLLFALILTAAVLGTCKFGDPAPEYACLTDTETLPGSIGPGTQASGKVVFDIPSTDGILVYSDGPSGGWEYPLSKK